MWEKRYARDGWAIESGQYQRTRRGRRDGLPNWYLDKPPDSRAGQFFLTAYSLLQTDRHFDQGNMGPIPWSSAIRYGREHGLQRSIRVWFAQVMLVLDATHRDHLRTQHDKEEKLKARRAKREHRLKHGPPTRERRPK